ncbi:MAG: hypothetical protein DYG90_06065 [Chloroflexi bacterium CFX6]|nr:hypothetical protein [Chloroflexi bacterium CFX6]
MWVPDTHRASNMRFCSMSATFPDAHALVIGVSGFACARPPLAPASTSTPTEPPETRAEHFLEPQP